MRRLGRRVGFAAKWQRPRFENLASEGKKTGGEHLGRTRKRGGIRELWGTVWRVAGREETYS